VKPPEGRSHAEVDAALAGTAWRREGDELVYEAHLGSFAAALGFVVSVGALAEARDHHPDISLRYRDVALRLTTHQIGGLSERDVELALGIEALR
jgi:4a-hydroxytetrahydrobiopterin dehydratase